MTSPAYTAETRPIAAALLPFGSTDSRVTDQVMTFPVPREFGLTIYRSAASAWRSPWACAARSSASATGSDAITVIAKNRVSVRDNLTTTLR